MVFGPKSLNIRVRRLFQVWGLGFRAQWLRDRHGSRPVVNFPLNCFFPPSRTRIANTKCRGSSKTSYVRQFLTRFRLTPHSLQADWPNAKEDQPLLCCCFVAFVWVFRVAFCWFGVLSACVFREGGCPKKAFELWLLGIYGLRVAKKFDALAASLVYVWSRVLF